MFDGQLDEAIKEQRQKLDEAQRKLQQVWQTGRTVCPGGCAAAGAAGDAQRATMQTFLERVTARKIERLSQFVTESFRFLLRKQTLVERIVIDPASFAITLWGPGGFAIARQRLSEGEKQIFAIAVLWGLARASARPLPAVIDTPMARLDAAHRGHLVERYFPNASHQVVIFSTDTEVDRHYYAALKPHIARAYHLDYDEQLRRSVGVEGYFWKECLP